MHKSGFVFVATFILCSLHVFPAYAQLHVPPNYVSIVFGQNEQGGYSANPNLNYNKPFATKAVREAAWTRTSTYWEVDYSGAGTPANTNMKYHLWFDNPHDDDLHEDPNGRGSCKYRNEDTGVLTVNRIKDEFGVACKESGYAPGVTARQFTGNISRRDEYLIGAHETGLVFETRIKIIDYDLEAQKDAFRISFQDNLGSFGVYLSPNCIKVGKIQQGHLGTEDRGCWTGNMLEAKELSDGDCAGPSPKNKFHKYRIVMHPRANGRSVIEVYVNDKTTACIDGSVAGSHATTHPSAGVSTYLPLQGGYKAGTNKLNGADIVADIPGNTDYEFPMILIGDAKGDDACAVQYNVDYSTAFVLDYFRYSRSNDNDHPYIPQGADQNNDDINDPALSDRIRKSPRLPKNSDFVGINETLPVNLSDGFVDGIDFGAYNSSVSGSFDLENSDYQNAGNGFTDSFGRTVIRDSNALNATSGYSIDAANGYLTMSNSEGQMQIKNLSYSTMENNTPVVKKMLGNDDWTFKLRARVRPNEQHDQDGFAFRIMDRIGTIDLYISNDRVKLGMGGKYWGRSLPVMMNDPGFKATDFHTYTLVRKQNDRYVTLYIDDYKIPALANFPMSASSYNRDAGTNEITIQLGRLTPSLPGPTSYDSEGRPIFTEKHSMDIDYIRWSSEDVCHTTESNDECVYGVDAFENPNPRPN